MTASSSAQFPTGRSTVTHSNSNCAFEIDKTHEFFESGWSIVVLGRLELATEDDFARMQYREMPTPWAGGNRYMFIRLPCEHVSGRRVIGHAR